MSILGVTNMTIGFHVRGDASFSSMTFDSISEFDIKPVFK